MRVKGLTKKTCRICGKPFYCKGTCPRPDNDNCRCWFCVAKEKRVTLEECKLDVCDLRASDKYGILYSEKVMFT